MATFVHLTPEPRIGKIRRNGIRPSRVAVADMHRAVFSMAVTENYYISHQWVRELKAEGPRKMLGVYFRIPDEEIVAVGHYGKAHQRVTAAEAIGIIRAMDNAEGFEILIPRRIDPTEFLRVDSVPHVVGWRHYPGANGKAPCGCDFCQWGRPGSRKLREAYKRDEG